LGIILSGTTAGAGGAFPGLGQERAGNARLDRVPRKHGLELSHGVTAVARAASGAPEGERTDRKVRCRASQARLRDYAPFGAPLPSVFREDANKFLEDVAKLGHKRAARTLLFFLPRFAGQDSVR
jgi:hypothetical protein